MQMDTLLTVEEYLANREAFYTVDVRSPGEFREASIPGAVNIPLFDDKEREIVGTVYWKEGTDRAKLVGLSIVGPKLADMVEKMVGEANGKTILLYCWRGGMRSSSVLAVLHALGYPAARLKGGYKAFRRHVLSFLQAARLEKPVFVLNGLTGVGKTLVIRKLRDRQVPALDLEGLANHRGSVFGAVGLGVQPSQKDFEARLFLELERFKSSDYLVVEGEGKRIGTLVLPDFLYDAMNAGPHILLEASLDKRVERILAEYGQSQNNAEELAQAVPRLEKRLGTARCQELAGRIKKGELAEVARVLCLEYYDKLYKDSRQEQDKYLATVDVNCLEAGVSKLLEVINNYVERQRGSGS